jgi:hypothetical protein
MVLALCEKTRNLAGVAENRAQVLAPLDLRNVFRAPFRALDLAVFLRFALVAAVPSRPSGEGRVRAPRHTGVSTSGSHRVAVQILLEPGKRLANLLRLTEISNCIGNGVVWHRRLASFPAGRFAA